MYLGPLKASRRFIGGCPSMPSHGPNMRPDAIVRSVAGEEAEGTYGVEDDVYGGRLKEPEVAHPFME